MFLASHLCLLSISIDVWVTSESVGRWVSSSITVSVGWVSVSIGTVVLGITVSLTLGNLVNNSGGALGVVAGGGLVDDWGNSWDGVGVVVLGNVVDNWGWCNDLSLLLNLLGGLNDGLGLLGYNWSNGGIVENGVVGVVVHGWVVVSSWDGILGHNWDHWLVVVCVGVVEEGVGFRLSEGHSGESENYELKDRKLV